MKKAVLLPVILILFWVFACTSCIKPVDTPTTPTPTSTVEPDDFGGGLNVPGQNGHKEDPPSEPAQEENEQRSTTYGPSIFVIEASGSWQQEIEKGYYANYECELYLDKIEPYNMHDDNGAYTGVLWFKIELDVNDYISEMLKDVPFVDISFDLEAEWLNDSMSFYLQDGYTRDPTANFDIPDGQGGHLKPDHGALADKGSFVAALISGNLSTVGQDSFWGILLEHESSITSDMEASYVVHVEPDPSREATERAVKIYLTLQDGSSTVLDGMWYRLSGYPEDLEDYYNSGKSREILERHQIEN